MSLNKAPSSFAISSVLMLGIISVSCSAIFIKFCVEVPALMIATWRMGIASAVLLLFTMITGKLRIPGHRALYFSIAGGFFLSLHFAFWITSLKYTSVACSVVLVTTNPIFVGILSFFLFGEKCSRKLMAGIILSIAGSVVLAYGDAGSMSAFFSGSNALSGDALALAGAIMASSYLLIGSRARPHMDILNYITWVYTFCALFLLIFSLAAGLSFTGYTAQSYFYLILLALVPQILGHSSFNWALAHIPANIVSVSILGEPVGATLLAWFFLQEKVNSLQFTGILMILCGIALSSLRKSKTAELEMDPVNP